MYCMSALLTTGATWQLIPGKRYNTRGSGSEGQPASQQGRSGDGAGGAAREARRAFLRLHCQPCSLLLALPTLP